MTRATDMGASFRRGSRQGRAYHARVVRALFFALACAACSGDADFSDAMPEPVTLVAEQYQTEILELDRLVFDPAPRSEARNAEIEHKFKALAERVKAAGDSKFLKLESLELKRLALAAERMRPQDLQNQWMRIRNNLFDDRWWFARSAADLDAVAGSAPPVSAVPTEAPAVSAESLPTPEPVVIGPSPDPELEGRWVVFEVTSGGKPNKDPELLGATAVFQGNRLTFQRTEGPIGRYSFSAVHDEVGRALHLKSDPDARDESGWIIYELANGVLRLALYDGLGKRPTGFTQPEGPGPDLIVVRLVRNP